MYEKERYVMKRIISFILAVSMVLTCIYFANAQESAIDTYSAEEKLKAIGISLDDVFVGESISRGDFARFMIRYLNLTPDNSEEYTRFIDVDTSHKAVGAVNSLYDLGYVAGCEGYKFYPDRSITYIEALSVIVNAFGYKHIVSKSDNWISGVLKVASDLDMLEGVVCNTNDYAKKEQLLKILENALEAEVMTISFGGTVDKISAIEQFHKTYALEGIVTGNKYTSLVFPKEAVRDNILWINDEEFSFENDYSDFLGCHVKCYYKNDDGELTGLYIEKTKRNNYVEVEGDGVQEFNEKYLLYSDDEEGVEKYPVEKLKIIYNGVAYTEYGQLSGIKFPNTHVKLLDNDNDGAYEVMFMTEYKNYYVTNVDVTNEVIYDGENNINVNLNSDLYDVVIYDENLNRITIEEIEKNVVISVTESKNTSGTVLKNVYVVKDTVSGRVTAIKEDEYEISDKYYKKSSECTQSILLGQQLTAYLSKDGKIVVRVVESTGGTFAVLYRMYEDEELENRVHMEFYTQNGDFEAYYAENKLRINNNSVKADITVLGELMNRGQAVIFENDGEQIKKVTLPQDENAQRGEFKLLASGTKSLSVRGNNGTNVLAGKVAGEKGTTSVMLVPSDPTEKEAYGLFDFAQIENMRDKTYKIFTTSSGKLNYADFVVLYDAAVAILNDDSNIYVVEDNTEGLTQDDIPANILTLSSPKNGISAKFVVSDTLDLSLTDGYNQVPITRIQGVELSEIGQGDTIAIATDAKGEVIRIEKIYDFDEPNNKNARFKVDDNLVDTCHYYPNKYVDMGRLVYTKIDAVSEKFIQFSTSVYPTADDWKNNTNVDWQLEIATMNENNILVYNDKTETSKKISRNELENYIGKKAVIRVNQCLMQEVIIYE